VNESTAKWLAGTPVEALLCRDLRHAWPRPVAAARRSRKALAVPPSGPNIVWRVLATGDGTAPRVLQRVMSCTAGCGVRRTEVFVARGDRLVRTGRPVLKYPSWYRRSRDQPDEPLEPLDTEVLRGSIITRMYPGLSW
jgi:hypothetical protein